MISEKITGMIMEATKNKETVRASVYKLIKNEFLKFKTAKNAKPLDEAAEIGILLKMVKQREESISQYKAGNRLDLANAEQLYSSPVFYLQQNDMIYVEPNARRAKESTEFGVSFSNPSLWISAASLLTTICVLIFN